MLKKIEYMSLCHIGDKITGDTQEVSDSQCSCPVAMN